MAYYIAPGVKFREIDLSEYAPALSTSICGIIGTATKGPINTATYITSAEQFIRVFGTPTPDSYMAYGALEFLARGSSLWVVRVCGGSYDGVSYTSAAKASIAVTGATSAGTVLGTNSEYFTITAATGGTTTGTEVENFTIALGTSDAYSFTIDAGVAQTGTIAAGTYSATTLAGLLNAATAGLTFADDGTGKLKITLNSTGASHNFSIDAIGSDLYTVAGLTAATYTGVDGTDEVSVTLAGVGAGTQTFTLTAGTRSAAQVAETINDTATNFVASADSLGRVKLVNSNTGLTNSITVDAVSTADTPLGFDNDVHAGTDGSSTTLTFYANSEGTWANSYKATISNADAAAETFDLALYTGDDIRLEIFQGLSKDSSSADFHQTILAAESNYITAVDVGAVSSVPVDGDYTLIAGVNGIADIVDADFVGTITATNVRTGLKIFSNPNQIGISILFAPGETAQAIQNALITTCEVDRKDTIAILDTDDDLTVQEAVNFMNGEGSIYSGRTALNSSYACLYYPWIKTYDAYNPTAGDDSDGYLWIPPSGFMAAQMAYTDYISDPWFPPAGPERGRLASALGVKYNCEEGDIVLMYGTPNSLNPIIEKDSIIQAYGQKTLQRAATSRDRIATRRMLNFAESVVSLSAGTILFEPNDGVTWRRFVRLVNPIFEMIKDRRGLYDFRVVCNESTNTSDLIANNTMAGQILMQHMKYTEIIQIDFVSTPVGVSFSEIEV